MTTTSIALPPLEKISMIGIWVETVLYGVNCVMYALSMLILLRGSNIATLRWVLVVTSTILILLATVHVGASLQQLLEAFVYAPADVPDYYSTIYWLNDDATLSVLKYIIYETLVFVQDFIIIWRLYVVFMYDWRVIVFPMILVAVSIGTAYSGTAISARPGFDWHDSVVFGLVTSAWVLDITLNVSVTMAIAGRLWWIGRTAASMTRTNRYALSVYATVESGAIFTGANIISLALYVSHNFGFPTALNVSSQVATLTPLLIIVQVGLTDQHRSSRSNYSKTVPTAHDGITFRVGVSQDSESQRAGLVKVDSTLSSLPNFMLGAQGLTK
ncbi:hypothetical protein HD554DRAFT_861945 [Boletus coccyginus]|nr:hypothetical protein HD554DRAFT_861945 [Boletus coccyginus]